MTQTRKDTGSCDMKAETVLDESMEALVNEYKELQEPVKSIWQELDEEGEEGEDRSWYEKFGNKMTGFKNDFIEKVKSVKVHLLAIEDSEKGEGMIDIEEGTMGPKPKNLKSYEQAKKQNYHLNTLSTILRKLQKLVKDHGTALEFVRELFVKQEAKIDILTAKVDNKPDEDWYKLQVSEAVDIKQEELTEELKDIKETLNRVSKENAELKIQDEALKNEVSETRQRGMKGNLVISCPDTRQGGPSKAQQLTRQYDGRVETPPEMCSRLIKEKTGCHIPPRDMMACHRIGFTDAKKNSWVVRVDNRLPDSGWEDLATGMVSGRKPDRSYFNTNDGIFINYMLEPTKSDLLRQIRILRKKRLVHKYSVNQNGRIMILKEKSPRSLPGQGTAREPWIEVKDLKTLRSNFLTISFPIEKERQEEVAT